LTKNQIVLFLLRILETITLWGGKVTDPSRSNKRSLPEQLGAMMVIEEKAVDGVAESVEEEGLENRNREVARRTCLVAVSDGTQV
jgi:hypothetical protein